MKTLENDLIEHNITVAVAFSLLLAENKVYVRGIMKVKDIHDVCVTVSSVLW